MKRLFLLFVLTISTIIYTQEEALTFTNADYMFTYPSSFTAALSITSPTTVELTSSDVQILVRGSSRLYEKFSAEEILLQLAEGGSGREGGELTFEDRPATTLRQTTDENEQYHIALALADGGLALISAYSPIDAMPVELVDAIAASLIPLTPGTRSYRAPNSGITLQQPLGFTIGEPVDNFLIISNTPDSLPVPVENIPMRNGTFQMLVYSDVSLIPDYVPQEGDTLETLLTVYLPDDVCGTELSCPRTAINTITLGAATGIYINMQFPALETLVYALEINEKQLLFAVYSAPDEMELFLPTALEVLASLQTYEYVIPTTADLPITLGELEVSVSSVWDAYQFGTDPLRITNRRGNVLERDGIFITIYPTLEALMQFTGYEAPSSVNDALESVPLYFSAIAKVSGAEITPIQTSSAEERAVSVVAVNPTEAADTTLLYYTVADGDDVMVVQIAVRRGYANDWQPFIFDFLTKIRKSG